MSLDDLSDALRPGFGILRRISAPISRRISTDNTVTVAVLSRRPLRIGLLGDLLAARPSELDFLGEIESFQWEKNLNVYFSMFLSTITAEYIFIIFGRLRRGAFVCDEP